MKIVCASATAEALPFDRLIEALRVMFRSECVVPRRHVHEIASAPSIGAGVTSLLMPAWLPGRYYGVKTVNIAPANGGLGMPGLHSTYMLYDATTGVPLALIDGDQITSRRTAAASALAASYLARDDARHLLVVGAGRVAELLPTAYRAVRAIERVSVWARSPDAATALVGRLRADGFEASAAPDLESAVRCADIVSCATLTSAPVVQGRWLAPGSHLDLIGSFTPAMREADDDCFVGADLYVDTDEALAKSGDLLGPMSRGVFAAGDVRGTLADLCRRDDRAADRRLSLDGHDPHARRAGRCVFKSVGTALEDLAAAMLVVEGGRG